MTKEEAKALWATHYMYVDGHKEYYRNDNDFWCRLIQYRKIWTWIRDEPNNIKPL